MESRMDVIDGPGSAVYGPGYTENDGAILPFQTRTQGAPANDVGPLFAAVIPDLPNPAIGGETGPLGVLGFTDGFLALRRKAAFTGRVIVRRSLGVHPASGPVGYTTRSQRLRNAVEALYSDYTPGSQEAAREIIENV